MFPLGFYVFNHSSTTIVKGKSFQQWFIDDYMLNEVGMSPLVSGFFWDDVWTSDKCFGGYDQVKDTCKDMGLTSTDLAQGTKAWNASAMRSCASGEAENLSGSP